MNILKEALKITSKDRREQYGNPKDNLQVIADIYNAIRGDQLTPEDIAYVMIAVKLAREQHKHKEDNLIDLAGYAWVLNEVIKK